LKIKAKDEIIKILITTTLTELQKNKELLNAIRVAATANEIAKIALGFGYQYLFSMYE